MDALPQDPEQSKTFPLTPSIQLYTESHSQSNKARKRNEWCKIGKKNKKGFSLTDNMTVYVETPRNLQKQNQTELLELTSEFSKIL